jgi:transcriptional regulator with XRE-family HTH domain
MKVIIDGVEYIPKPSQPMTIGQTFRKARRALDMTLKKVSEATDISISHLCELEKDVRLPSMLTLRTLTKFYNLDHEVMTEAVIAEHHQRNYP